MGSVKHVSSMDFESEVLGSETPVLVDFWAPWCGPCRMIAPVVESLAQEMNGKLKVVKLNVDENQSTAFEYGIMSIPTMGVFKGGRMVNRLVGYMPKDELKRRLTPVLQ